MVDLYASLRMNEPAQAIAIGSSAGGIDALSQIIKSLNPSFQLPIFITQHIGANSENYLVHHLDKLTHLRVKEATDKEQICQGTVYLAPPNYHLLIEEDFSITLTVDEKVSYARPSIDVMFETAARAYQQRLVAVILTGANNDGTAGAAVVKEFGGKVIAQDPASAYIATMPESVITNVGADLVGNLIEIAEAINLLG